MVGRAGGAEHLALPGLDHALQHLTALTGLGVGHADAWNLVADLGVPVRELLPKLEGALGDEAETAPLEGGAQLHGLGDHLEREWFARLSHHAAVLVLDL